ncbi:hypothetical protein COY17_02670 [Candidatus Saccharibacteria bacterium CG_4_10_14_0_2_um_filter_52_9]|nr:MAG: hypothetical protein COY17_02670 [Candidatus Saccharibacteria bacterium CG_4_10_14_0_2_um_filter_52_9]
MATTAFVQTRLSRVGSQSQSSAQFNCSAGVNCYSVTGTFKGGWVSVSHYGGEFRNDFSGITQSNCFDIKLDGAIQYELCNGTVGNGSRARLREATVYINVSAGSHTISIQNPISDGTGSVSLSGSNFPILFGVMEQ